MQRMPGYMGRYPTMVYNPENGQETMVCNSADEIPEGWVDNLRKCKGGPDYAGTLRDEEGTPDGRINAQQERVDAVDDEGELSLQPQHVDGGEPSKSGVDEPASGGVDAGTRAKDVKKPTLKSLKITRKEAEDLLREEGVAFPPDATAGDLAELVTDLLAEED